MRTCIDCGEPYPYDPKKPAGASTERCAPCRKRNTAKNQKIILFSIATAGDPPYCFKCGYNQSVHALTLVDARNHLKKAANKTEQEKRAKEQYLLCLNCKAEIDSREYGVKVKDISKTPVIVEFYHTHVSVVKEILPPFKETSRNAIEAEIVTGETEGTQRAAHRTRNISADPVSDLQIDV